MKNYDHESYWPQIQSLAESDSPGSIVALSQKMSTPAEQIAFLRFAIRCLMFRLWRNKSTPVLTLLGDETIATPVRAGDIEQANITCFNMAANLAGCWDDGFRRSPDDFCKGLAYAEQALKYRQELKKGPEPFALAYWAKGIHLLFLGKLKAAEESFLASLDSARLAAEKS